ncbi:ribonuclease P protein component [Salinimicrobium flavum]|uniref:Ribonuclease P protein component n=1 Tax=Salinimicrobium flavum TaxID=1737065 RepID=A0ABW5IV68_9FLAO
MNQSFGKQERLKSKILIEKLFSEGRSIKKYPLLLLYLPIKDSAEGQNQTGVSVSKRNFKRAVDRMHLKRLMREAFRKNKYLVNSNLESSYAFMFIYIGREKLTYSQLFTRTEELLKKLVQTEKDRLQ